MTGALANPTVQRWLPVVVLPPILLLDGLLSTKAGSDPGLFGVLCAYVATLPLVLRERLSFLALAPLLVAGCVLLLWAFEPGTTVVLLPAWALFDLARERGRRETILAAVAIVPCVVISVLPFCDDGGEFVSITLRNLALCELALAAGYAMWHHRAALEREASASAADAAKRLDEERLRMAREVHDVVAHAMVAINVQAGVAAHLGEARPEQTREALLHIKQTSGDALADLRTTLGILRDTEQAAPVAPSAGLADLDVVAAQLRASGVQVELDVDAELDRPPDAARPVHAAGYRIVQEALTNVLRHAGARSVRVVARVDGARVRIVVDDDGSGASTDASGAGAGLRGMRERAEALGGTLAAGPGAAGGWHVEATLPWERAAA